MIQTIIVDDERSCREVLKMLLTAYADVEVVGEADSMEQAIQLIKTTRFDVLFLDIKMNRGTGFDILQQIPDPRFKTIFVTSYEEYAFKAIKTNAFDYLLKPVQRDELTKSIEKLRLLLVVEEKTDVFARKILIQDGNKVRPIPIYDIYFCEADGNYCKIHTATETFTLAKPIKQVELDFLHGHGFVRINKTIVINTQQIIEYTKQEPCLIRLKNNACFEISRRRKQLVLEQLKGN